MNMTANNVICICHHPTPAGNMIIGSYGDHLCLCDWEMEEEEIVLTIG